MANQERSAVDFLGAGVYGQVFTYGVSLGLDVENKAFALSVYDQVSAVVAVSGGTTFTYNLNDGLDTHAIAAVGVATPTGLPGLAAGSLKNLKDGTYNSFLGVGVNDYVEVGFYTQTGSDPYENIDPIQGYNMSSYAYELIGMDKGLIYGLDYEYGYSNTLNTFQTNLDEYYKDYQLGRVESSNISAIDSEGNGESSKDLSKSSDSGIKNSSSDPLNDVVKNSKESSSGSNEGSGDLGVGDKDISKDAPSSSAKNSGGSEDSSSGKPIVIDMDGDGIELTQLTDSVTTFDFDNDGYLEGTAWTSSDDALLVFDINDDNQWFYPDSSDSKLRAV